MTQALGRGCFASPGVVQGRFQPGNWSRAPEDSGPLCWQPGDASRTSNFSFPSRTGGKKKKSSWFASILPPGVGSQSLCALLFQGFPAKPAGSALSSFFFFLKFPRCFPCSGVPNQRFGRCGTSQSPFDVAVMAPFGAEGRQGENQSISSSGNINRYPALGISILREEAPS